jgi:PAS domain S-box-containing protein
MTLLLHVLFVALMALAWGAASWSLGSAMPAVIALSVAGSALAHWVFLRSMAPMARAVAAHEASKQKFSLVFDASPNWIVITRLSDGVIIDANMGFEQCSGHLREAAIGRPMSELNVWVHVPERTAIIGQLVRDGRVVNARAQLRRSDGEIRDYITNATLISLEGQTRSHAVWIATDVTEAGLAEKALRESEARFANLFEMSPMPTSYSFDTDDYSTFYRNAAFYQTFGFDPQTDAAKSTSELNLWVNPEDGVRARNIRVSGHPVDNWQVQVRHADGRHRWVALFGRFIVEPRRTMVITTLLDITEQRLAQQTVEDLNATLERRVLERTTQLEQANGNLSEALQTLELARDSLVQSEKLASLGALVAGVAHEINTPVGNGLIVASALDERVRDFAVAMGQPMQRSRLELFVNETQTAVDLLVRSLTRAATLVTSFKQVAVDQTSSQRRTFELAELVDEVVLTISPTTRRAQCKVEVQIAPLPVLDSFPGPLVQVLTNLINNALVHGFADGRTGCITISAVPASASQIEITVQDDGAGIAPKHIKRIFDPFFTTRMGQGGSGLGLHIVHNIVTGVLGGRIDVHSGRGQGARFVMVVPVVAPQMADGDPGARHATELSAPP